MNDKINSFLLYENTSRAHANFLIVVFIVLAVCTEYSPGPTSEVLVPHSINKRVESSVENSNPVDKP